LVVEDHFSRSKLPGKYRKNILYPHTNPFYGYCFGPQGSATAATSQICSCINPQNQQRQFLIG
jgi:hypothetical protein